MANLVKTMVLASKNANTLTGGYDVLSTDGFPPRVFSIKLVNNSDRDLEISYDGINSHDFVKTGETSEFISSMPINTDNGNYFLPYTKVYVKAAVGTGSIHLVIRHLN